MASFNEKLWFNAAQKNFQKSLSAGKNEQRSRKRLTEDIRYISALHVVVEWCQSKSLAVVFNMSNGSFYYPTLKKIIINDVTPKNQVMSLLHECGHYLISKSRRSFRRFENADDIRKKDSYRIDVVDEEFEAWHRAWKLARRLNVLDDVDKVEFDKVRNAALKSYAFWLIKDPKYDYID